MRQCPICLEGSSEAESQSVTLSCGHGACKDCLQGWFTAQLTEFTDLKFVCPEHECRRIVPDVELEQILNQEQLDRLQTARLRHYISKTADIHCCPRQGCDFAAVVTDCRRFECEKCGLAADLARPSGWSFNLLEAVTSVRSAFTTFVTARHPKNVLWKLLHTRSCGKCSAPIEKNGGCHHMTCSRCRYQFCWTCGHPWPNHKCSVGPLNLRTVLRALVALLAVGLGCLLSQTFCDWTGYLFGWLCSMAVSFALLGWTMIANRKLHQWRQSRQFGPLARFGIAILPDATLVSLLAVLWQLDFIPTRIVTCTGTLAALATTALGLHYLRTVIRGPMWRRANLTT